MRPEHSYDIRLPERSGSRVHCRVFGILLTLALSAFSLLESQTAARYSVQGSVLYSALRGTDYKTLYDGGGFEIQGRFRWPPFGADHGSPWTIGLGYQETYHTVTPYSGHERISGALIEPRYTIDVGRDAAFPYLSFRAAWLSQHLASGSVSGSTRGATIDPGGGILVRVGGGTLLDVGAAIGYASFGTYTLKNRNTTATSAGPAGSGLHVLARIGLAHGVGQ